VASDCRRKNVGQNLIATLLAKTKEDASLEQILLAVATGNEAARRLYRKFGFETYGTEPRALKVASTYIDEDHMILKLN
jgi:ribosomal protein S18 acetylase RimI-like enzyme